MKDVPLIITSLTHTIFIRSKTLQQKSYLSQMNFTVVMELVLLSIEKMIENRYSVINDISYD